MCTLFSPDEFKSHRRFQLKAKSIYSLNIRTMPALNQLSAKYQERLNSTIPIQSYKLDSLSFEPGQLIIIGSRPGMGKSIFLMFMLQTFFEQSKDGFLFISNEQTELKCFKNLACQVSSIAYSSIDSVMDEVISTHSKLLNSDRIFIKFIRTDWEKQKEQIVEMIMQNSIKFLFIDKLQGLRTDKQFNNRDQELESILSDLKQIAFEYNLIIVATSSLSRSVEHREGKRPQLSDLRCSGSIEEISDVVLMLMRYEYYGITEDEDGNSLLDIAEIIISKNNLGPTSDMKFQFIKKIPQFKYFTEYQKMSFTKEFDRKYNSGGEHIPF